MNSHISHFPNGEAYLALQYDTNWHHFPYFADKLLGRIGAYSIEPITVGQVIDTHWYEFSWQGARYRLVYGDWPPECLIEKLSDTADLNALRNSIETIEINKLRQIHSNQEQ